MIFFAPDLRSINVDFLVFLISLVYYFIKKFPVSLSILLFFYMSVEHIFTSGAAKKHVGYSVFDAVHEQKTSYYNFVIGYLNFLHLFLYLFYFRNFHFERKLFSAVSRYFYCYYTRKFYIS